MFKLIAFLFLVSNGAEKPAAALKYIETFPSQEACMNFFDTAAGKVTKQKIEKFVTENSRSHKIKIRTKFSCVKEEDNSI